MTTVEASVQRSSVDEEASINELRSPGRPVGPDSTTTMHAKVGGGTFEVTHTRTAERDSVLGQALTALGLSFAAFAVLGSKPQQTSGAVLALNANEPAMIAAGQASSSNYEFGAIRQVFQSGAVGYSSVTMITDLDGNLLPTAPQPAGGTIMEIAGFGSRARQGGVLQPQDGLPVMGTGMAYLGFPSYINPTYFGLTRFNPTVQGDTNVNGAPGDSGGRVSLNDVTVGIVAGAQGGTGSPGILAYTRLDVPEVQDWISSYTQDGGIWGLTNAHVARVDANPVNLTSVMFTDANNPTLELSVLETHIYPTSLASGSAVTDWMHPDLALVKFATVPEPAVIGLIASAGLLLGRRRRE